MTLEHTSPAHDYGRLLDNYLTDPELADELGIDKRTLQRWRRLSKAPAHIQMGNRNFTHRQVAADWLKAC